MAKKNPKTTTPPTLPPDPLPPVIESIPPAGFDWSWVLWREWRTCNDADYARVLFLLLVTQPPGRFARGLLLLLNLLSGSLAGVLAGWLFGKTTPWALPAVALAGGAMGAVVGAGLIRRCRTWQVWLRGLLPSGRWAYSRADGWLHPPAFLLAAGGGSALGVYLTGALFFGDGIIGPAQLLSNFIIPLGILGIISVLLMYLYLPLKLKWAGPMIMTAIILGGLAGLAFGLFFGLGLVQPVALLFGPLSVAASARAVGLAVGAGVGLVLGRQFGLLSVLALAGGLSLSPALFDASFTMPGWLLGLLLGGQAGAAGQVFWPDQTPLTFERVYAWRNALLWWFRRPVAGAIEAALAHTPNQPQGLKSLLARLEADRPQPQPVEQLLASLDHSDWQQRFLARHLLARRGGRVVAMLLDAALLPDGIRFLFLPTEVRPWLLASIGAETGHRLAESANELLCTTCLTACIPNVASGWNITWYGCRTCGQSDDFYHAPGGVSVALDSRQTALLARSDGRLRVNWLLRRELFDFDRVEIIAADDEAVERFAVQVGNDTDPRRTLRYREMPCVIGPDSHLSANTLKILGRTFGRVSGPEAGL